MHRHSRGWAHEFSFARFDNGGAQEVSRKRITSVRMSRRTEPAGEVRVMTWRPFAEALHAKWVMRMARGRIRGFGIPAIQENEATALHRRAPPAGTIREVS